MISNGTCKSLQELGSSALTSPYCASNMLLTVSDVKVLESGCCSGSDQYAVSIRKTNRPEQTVSVVDEDGLVCLYDIKVD